jgi:hypothetical protein
MREFLLDRVRLVRDLQESEIPHHYADLALILCSVLSACAADRWPAKRGERIDRKRFVELLVKRSPDDAHTSWICVPALINRGLVSEADTPYGPGQSTRIFTDDEIDLPLDAAAAKYPQVDPPELKRSTYAVLIYEWLRCGYAHAYWGDENTTHVAPSRREARVSYIGRGVQGGGLRRMVGFHLDYLIGLAEHHAADVEDKPSSPRPATWWLD